MLKLFVYCLVFSACFAQQHLTCLRTDEMLTQSAPQPPQKVVQGARGKAGPRGLKGEPGTPADKEEMRLIQEQLHSLTQQVKDVETRNTEIRQVLINSPRPIRSYTPFNGYIYRTIYTFNMTEARKTCARMGGDIAMHRVKTLEERRLIFYGLTIRYDVCIGLTYNATQLNWVWVNGEPANSSEILWAPGQPNIPGEDSTGSGDDFSGSGEDSTASSDELVDLTNHQNYCVAIKYSNDPLENGRAVFKIYRGSYYYKYYLCEWKY